MRNLYLLIFISFLSICSSCSNDKDRIPEVYTIDHFNVIITTDLSNRLEKVKPLSDYEIVETTINNVLPKVLKHDRETDQEDEYTISLTSEIAINKYNIDVNNFKISFKKFESQIDRIEYINNNSTNTLAKDKQALLNEYNKLLESAVQSPEGADIWSYFNQRVDNTLVIDKGDTITDGGDKFINRHRNIMLLLTDGYIEASMYGGRACENNLCYYLSSERIKEFRAAYKKSGIKNLREFFEKNSYGIIPAKNENLKNLEILVLQLEDRSQDRAGNATVYPSDSEILQLFWSDWLSKSGVNKFELRSVMSSKDVTEKVILDFMGIK